MHITGSDVDVDVSSWTLIQSSTGPSNTDHFLQTGNSYSTKLYIRSLLLEHIH
jgi:hypothetical protein